ncbi:type VI secretion system ImpA family N-terminal domain-containing protein [Vibrio kyushuensis]|uniref:type VI secretion system protein TssA n=1 Tax=Vibrio kyushuensis TaxID=2910249 RepID=UPI003D119CCA
MVDVNSLLAPISDDKPCGTYLKLDRTAYRGLRNAYNSAQSSFRQLSETPDASSNQELLEINDAHWDTLRTSTQDALTKQTKDLEILGWYITSQLFTREPFANFSLATQVLNTLVEEHWADMNPLLPEEKRKATDEQAIAKEITEFRLKPLLQLIGESPDSTAIFMPLQMLPLVGDVSFSDYLVSERNGTLSDIKQSALNQFSSEVADTLNNLSNAYQQLSNTEHYINEQCQKVAVSAVSFKFIKSNIADFINAIKHLVGEKFSHWPLDDNYAIAAATNETSTVNASPLNEVMHSTQAGSSEATQTTSDSQNPPANPIVTTNEVHQPPNSGQVLGNSGNLSVTSRDQAFHELRKIADYFKQAEPHSPISFLLERAIRWGYLSLPELLEEMVGRDSQMLQHINQLTGMDNLEKTDLAGVSNHSPSTFTPNALPTSNGGSLSSNNPSVNANDSAANTATPTNTQTNTGPETSQDSGTVTSFEW